MRTGLAAGLGALLIGVPGLACGSEAEPEPGAVRVVDFAFEPARATVSAGTVVSWRNTGEQIHNVRGKGFFSEAINPDGEYAHEFENPGEYRYLCTLHPDSMRGTIVVER